MSEVASIAPPRSRLVINVELDDRSFLFPDGKTLSHLSLHECTDDTVRVEGIFHFNESRHDTVIARLEPDDAGEFARAIIDAVYQGRTQHVLSDRVKIAIVFNPNGFVIKFGEERALREVFINSPAIIRVAQAMLRLVDRLSAVPAH